MHLVKETIPGAGERWIISSVMERMMWLGENTSGPFKSWWGSNSVDCLSSDDHYISFENEVDATAYTLKWIEKWK